MDETKDKVRVAVRIRPCIVKRSHFGTEKGQNVNNGILQVIVDGGQREKVRDTQGQGKKVKKMLVLTQPSSSSVMSMSISSNKKLIDDSNMTDNANVMSRSSCGSSNNNKQFTFDHIFDQMTSQEEIFDEIGLDIVGCAFDGYNTCLFAYGQTGSGKTFTMLGATTGDDEKGRGVIPRVCDQLFQKINKSKDDDEANANGQKLDFKVEVSYMEIYNERVRDLLCQSQNPQQSQNSKETSHQSQMRKQQQSNMKRSTSMTIPATSPMSTSTSTNSFSNTNSNMSMNTNTSSSSNYLKVREHAVYGPYVDGLSILAVESSNDVFNLLDTGNKSRTVAATNMNSESSRSHAVFTLILTQKVHIDADDDEDNESSLLGMEKVSKISLVDLAGSERANKTGAVGERLKEGSNINKSLTTLGLVISKLADGCTSGGGGQNFIPYRDSILTWLLKDNLGGNSKTFMIATVSPSYEHYEETLSTLRYADRAKKIVNHAIVNEDPNSKLIRELQEEVQKLREQLGKPSNDVEPKKLMKLDFSDVKVIENENNLSEQLNQSERLIRQVSESWGEKLKRSERIQIERQTSLQKMGISIKESSISTERFSIVNLNSDPSLSELLVYFIDKEKTLVGLTNDDNDTSQNPEIQLCGLGIKKLHCEFLIKCTETEEDDVKERILSMRPHKGAKTYVNGELINEGTEKSLNHGDRILFGNHHYFKVKYPNGQDLISDENRTENDENEQISEYELAREEFWRKQMMIPSPNEVLQELERKHEEEKAVALEKQRKDLERQFTTLMKLVNVNATNNGNFAQLSAIAVSPTSDETCTIKKMIPTIHSMMNLNLSQHDPVNQQQQINDTIKQIPTDLIEVKGEKMNDDLYILKEYLREATRICQEANEISKAISIKVISKIMQINNDGFMRNFCSGELLRIVYNVKLIIPPEFLSPKNNSVPPPSIRIVKKRIDLRNLITCLNKKLKFRGGNYDENIIEEQIQEIEEIFIMKSTSTSAEFGHEKNLDNNIENDDEIEELWSMEKLQNRIIEMREFYFNFPNAEIENNQKISSKMNYFKDIMNNLKLLQGIFYDIPNNNDTCSNDIRDPKHQRLIGIGNIFLQPELMEYSNLTLKYPVPVINQSGEICGILQIEFGKLNTIEEHEDHTVISVQVTIRHFSFLILQECFNYIFCRYEFCGEVISIPSESKIENDRKNVKFEHTRIFNFIHYLTPNNDNEDYTNNMGSNYKLNNNNHHSSIKSLAIQVWASKSEVPQTPLYNNFTNSFQDRFEEGDEEDDDDDFKTEDFGFGENNKDNLSLSLSENSLSKVSNITKSVTERWKEVTSHIKFWVEIQELNEHGLWMSTPVVPTKKSSEMISSESDDQIDLDESNNEEELIGGAGGEYLLRQGQQRRIKITISNLDDPSDEFNLMKVPIVLEKIDQVSIGAITLRSTTMQKPLDSYQEEDLNTLRWRWGEALSRRREYLDKHLQILAKKSENEKSKEEKLREDSLVSQWLLLTEERDAVLLPRPDSGVPGAPISKTSQIDEYIEIHRPILFLDLSEDLLDLKKKNSISTINKVKMIGVNNLLPKEHGAEFFSLPFVALPLMNSSSSSNEINNKNSYKISTLVTWDSSQHVNSCNYLNRPTGKGQVVYLILRISVRLSHPIPDLNCILRKRLCLRILPSNTKLSGYSNNFLRSLVNFDYYGKAIKYENGDGHGGGTFNSNNDSSIQKGTGVIYQVVSHLPRSSEQLEANKEDILLLAVQTFDHNIEKCSSIDEEIENNATTPSAKKVRNEDLQLKLNCEIYLEEFLRSLSTVDTILNLDRMRQSIALREQIEKLAFSPTDENPPVIKRRQPGRSRNNRIVSMIESPTNNLFTSIFSNLKTLGTAGGKNIKNNLKLFTSARNSSGSEQLQSHENSDNNSGHNIGQNNPSSWTRIRKTFSVPNISQNLSSFNSQQQQQTLNNSKILIHHEENEENSSSNES